jgi:hypothetical protein
VPLRHFVSQFTVFALDWNRPGFSRRVRGHNTMIDIRPAGLLI